MLFWQFWLRCWNHWGFGLAREEVPMAQTVVGVVDNDPGMLRAVARLLTAHGFLVQPYVSAEAFLKVVTNNAARTCLVVDIHLDGMSGIDLRRHLVALPGAPPVIFMTAFDNPSTRQEAREAGCVAYLQKPFPSSQLIEAIANAAASSAVQRAQPSESEPLQRGGLTIDRGAHGTPQVYHTEAKAPTRSAIDTTCAND